MSDPLGLSIGATNLVAARVGRPPVMRRAVLTLFSDRAPEVGVAAENPALNQPGVVLSGFVERVGDPVPSSPRTAALTAPNACSSKHSTRWPTRWAAVSRSPSRCPRTGDPPSSAHCAARCGTSRTCRPAACPPRWYRTP